MPYEVPQHIASNKVFIVNFSELEGRLDPAFYNPQYYKYINSKTVNWVRLNAVTENIKHPPEYKRNFVDEGYQLIRSQNVRPTGIDLSENPVYLAKDVVLSTSAIFPHVNDILIVRSGVNAGDVAVVEDEFKNVTIGADTLLLNVNQEVLPKFVQVYFFTEIGRSLLNRYITGATNKHLNSYSLKHVYFPKIEISVQKNCNTIIESALSHKQQKEQEAQHLIDSIDPYLFRELGVIMPEIRTDLKHRIFFVNRKELNDRLDPKYNKDYSYLKSLSSAYTWVTLNDVVLNNGQYGANESAIDYNSGDVRYIRITDIDELGYLKETEKKSAANIDNTYMLSYNDVLFARSGSVGKCYIHKSVSEPAIYAGYLIRFVLDKKKIDSDYLFYYCNSKLYALWVETIQRPAVQANINAQEFRKLVIPLPPLKKQKEIASHILDIRQKAKALQEEGKNILEQAKKEVERMIIGYNYGEYNFRKSHRRATSTDTEIAPM